MADITSATSQIQGAVNDIVKASILMQTYTAGFLNQAPVTLSSAPEFNVHLGSAQQVVRSFTNTGLVDVFIGEDAVEGFANTVGAFIGQLESLTDEANNGNTTAKTTLLQGLSELQSTAGKQLLAAQNLASELDTLAGDFDQLAGNFTGDIIVIQKAGGTEVQQLQQQLQTLNTALDEDFATIAAGATNALPGLFLIVVGTAVLVASEGEESEILKSGIETTSEELGEVTKASDDAKAKIQQYGSLLTSVADVQAQMAAAVTIQNAGDGCRTQAAAMQTAAHSLVTGWTGVQSGLLALGTEAASAPTGLPAGFEASLANFGSEWKSLGEFVHNMEGFDQISIQVTPASGKAVGA